MNQQPLFAKNEPNFPDISGKYPVADYLSKQGFYLPSSSSLKPEEIKFITDTLLSIE